MLPQSDLAPAPTAREDRGENHRLADLGQLAAVIAHDFNNVLSIISGCASLLRRIPDLTPTHARELDDLDGAVRHGAQLVSQVFAFGRPRPAGAGDVDLNKVIASMDWMLRRLGRKSVTVDLVLAHGLGPVRAEEVQVEQVILNLALNARDAMPDGGQLVIETSDAYAEAETVPGGPPPAGYVRLAISDSGQGIPEEVQARMFQPFFTTKEHGTGLGLFSVRRIVEQCGGYIRLYSLPGEGTTFEIYFPRAAAPSPSPPL